MPCQGRRILNPVCLPFHHSGLVAASIGRQPVCYRTRTTIQVPAGQEPVFTRLNEPRMEHGSDPVRPSTATKRGPRITQRGLWPQPTNGKTTDNTDDTDLPGNQEIEQEITEETETSAWISVFFVGSYSVIRKFL